MLAWWHVDVAHWGGVGWGGTGSLGWELGEGVEILPTRQKMIYGQSFVSHMSNKFEVNLPNP